MKVLQSQEIKFVAVKGIRAIINRTTRVFEYQVQVHKTKN